MGVEPIALCKGYGLWAFYTAGAGAHTVALGVSLAEPHPATLGSWPCTWHERPIQVCSQVQG